MYGRLGHSSTRAALLYQHATVERERQIADKLNDMITAACSAQERAEVLIGVGSWRWRLTG